VAAGQVSDALVSASDLLATICELTGVEVPLDPELDSVSFVRHLRRPMAPSKRHYAYAELFDPNFIPNRVDPMDECSQKLGGPPPGYTSLTHTRAICNQRFKLIEWWEACDPITGNGLVSGQSCLNGCDAQAPKCLVREELYDLDLDFYEQVNLAPSIPPGDAQEAYDSLKARLAAKYPLLP
jgi:arylsulfatase A-like enzyme